MTSYAEFHKNRWHMD